MLKTKRNTRPMKAVWTTQDTDYLIARLRELGIDLPPEQHQKLARWSELLLQWNSTYNLLGAQDSRTLVEEHLLDSLVVHPALERLIPDSKHSLTDVGTGAGFPGILLAITQPDRPIRLVEPIGKKVAFLRQSVLTLQLKNAHVLAGKIEDLPALLRHERVAEDDQPPHFICRAFTALGRFAALCEPYMSEDSLAFAMKAARLPEEQLDMPSGMMLASVETLATPRPDIQRYLAVMKKASATSPRPEGQPSSDTASNDPRRTA